MQGHPSSETASSVLDPKTPPDIGERSQRRRIVDAMIASCAEKTYAGTTISDIVAGAKISRTTFYKRFRDKRDCFGAALDHCLEEVCAAAAGSRSPTDSPPEAVRKATAVILDLLASRPDLAQLLVGDAILVEPAVIERYRGLLILALEDLWGSGGGRRPAHTDPRIAFGRAQLLIFNQIAAGSADRLAELLPAIVYLAVAPFAGHEEALRQSRLVEEGGSGVAG